MLLDDGSSQGVGQSWKRDRSLALFQADFQNKGLAITAYCDTGAAILRRVSTIEAMHSAKKGRLEEAFANLGKTIDLSPD
jgi:hypothetical protein